LLLPAHGCYGLRADDTALYLIILYVEDRYRVFDSAFGSGTLYGLDNYFLASLVAVSLASSTISFIWAIALLRASSRRFSISWFLASSAA
jgi:hypothetical protein